MSYSDVENRIKENNKFKNTLVLRLPNITNIVYGRDVGYKIEQEVFDDATHAISATKIRKQMGIE